ncbi:hypothetical protein TNCV_3559721 [Trichonephila clavipes]|uniref:Uncharacterized protein n=1 Tax=Trichonephila clavipes TaxID=2585209 RepID=A0A8X7BJ94_TRICX|nr:hypothetical protein TNCV_3559721 [Trichonephila clavipes]
MTPHPYRTHQQQCLPIFIKADVQIVYRADQGRLERSVEWIRAAPCPPMYRQHADEHRLLDKLITVAKEPDPYYRSSSWSMPHPANYVQEHKNAPEPLRKPSGIMIYLIFLVNYG